MLTENKKREKKVGMERRIALKEYVDMIQEMRPELVVSGCQNKCC